MHLEGLLHPASRVIELGAHDQELGTLLLDRDVTRYLSLVEPERLEQVRSSGPLHDRVQPLSDDGNVARCSTDLLVLRPAHARAMWAVHDEVGARFIALLRDRSAAAAEGHLARLIACLVGRARPVGQARLGDSLFDIVEVRDVPQRQPRMYFSAMWGAQGLAARLEDAGLNYVVLRWFEDLPHIQPGEDLDILVADEDLEAFRALVDSEPGTQPLDLYSVSGLPFSDFHNAAYYPPQLARQILDNSVVHASGFRVPAPDEHLRSLAYHAVYHKGLGSGLRSEVDGKPARVTDHDYGSHLSALASANAVDLTPTLEGVDRYLSSVGWRPPTDALRRLADVNQWAATLMVEAHEESLPGSAELAVFLLRARARDVVGYDEVLGLLDHYGFETLLFEELGEQECRRATEQLRGGNWGQGPFPTSGGNPIAIVAALHHAPVTPYPWLAARYPHLTNAETWELKDGLRKLIEKRLPAAETFNPIHSSDNMGEAWEYLSVVTPEKVAELRRLATERARALLAPEGTLNTLSVGRRARVDVIDGPEGTRVRKTFIPAFHRFLEREIAGRRNLSGRISAVPALGEVGPNWIETPFYHDTLPARGPRPLPLRLLREMVEVLRRVHAAGYDVVDAKPTNFLVDAREGVKLIDLEFLYEYRDSTPPLSRSVNFVGPWPGFDGDLPVGDMSYESRWLPYAGMPVEILTEGTALQQRLHRAAWALRRATVLPGSPPRRALSRARALARHQKWLAKHRFDGWSQRRAGHGQTTPRPHSR